MTFANIPAGISLFVDANVFIYHFGWDPLLQAPCQELLERIARQELTGFTTVNTVTEMAHRLMTLEAININGLPANGIAQRLRNNPAEVQKLTRFRQAIQGIPQFGIQFISTPETLLDVTAAVSQTTGLLISDALIVAVMQANGLGHVASTDRDFDRVPGLGRMQRGRSSFQDQSTLNRAESLHDHRTLNAAGVGCSTWFGLPLLLCQPLVRVWLVVPRLVGGVCGPAEVAVVDRHGLEVAAGLEGGQQPRPRLRVLTAAIAERTSQAAGMQNHPVADRLPHFVN
jgi:predicted nucleic acid-binding protein